MLTSCVPLCGAMINSFPSNLLRVIDIKCNNTHVLFKLVTESMHRNQELSQVTEDDVNEVKGDICTLRSELLSVFKNNGMNIFLANKNTKVWHNLDAALFLCGLMLITSSIPSHN